MRLISLYNLYSLQAVLYRCFYVFPYVDLNVIERLKTRTDQRMAFGLKHIYIFCITKPLHCLIGILFNVALSQHRPGKSWNEILLEITTSVGGFLQIIIYADQGTEEEGRGRRG